MLNTNKFFSAFALLLCANYAPLAKAEAPSTVTVSVYDNESEKRPSFRGTFEGEVLNSAGFITFMLTQGVFSMREGQFLLATCDHVIGGQNDTAKVVCARAGNRVACQKAENDILGTWEKVKKIAQRAAAGVTTKLKKKTKPAPPEEGQLIPTKDKPALVL